MDTMEDEDENDVGGFIQNGWNRHNNAAISMAHNLLMPSASGVLLSSTVLVDSAEWIPWKMLIWRLWDKVQDSHGVLLEKCTALAILCAQKHAKTDSLSTCAKGLAELAAIAYVVT